MAAAVYYKFKSAKIFDSILIEGQYISVACLKRLIFAKHLGKGKDFDINIFDANTNEEYVDDSALICKQTAVLIQRVPGLPRKPIVVERDEPKVDDNKSEELPPPSSVIVSDSTTMKYPEESDWNEFVKDLSSIPELLPMESTKPVVHVSAASKIDEDEKIKALVETPALDWNCHGHNRYGGGRGSGRGMGVHLMSGHGFGRGGFERKTPPTGYVCHRCRVPGHFIQHCPTNGDPNYDSKRMKPPSGIPRSMLMETSDGSYALPSAAAAVLKPNEAAFEKEIGGIPSVRHVIDLPPELRCPLCKEVMKDAVLTGKCCFRSFCDNCIRDYIVTKKMCACRATKVLSDDLVPNKTLRDTISRILQSATSSSENAGSLEHVQDVESSHRVQHRVCSPTQSAASIDEHEPLPIDHSSDVKKGDTCKVEDASEVKVVTDGEKHYLDKKTTKDTDASEATPESTGPQEIISHETSPMPEEIKEKFVGEKGKKKRKKTTSLPESAVDLGTEAYAGMPLTPSTFYPWWTGGTPVGIDGCMAPFAANFSYIGYPSGFSDGTFGVMQPQGQLPAQYYMMSSVLPRERPKDSRGVFREVNNSHGGADDSSVKTKLVCLIISIHPFVCMSLLSATTPNTEPMQRLALLRSLSGSSTACRRLASRLRPRPRPFSSSSYRHGLHHRQKGLRSLSCSSVLLWRPLTAPSLHPRKNFSFAPVAVSTSPKEAFGDVDGSHDIAEKLGFEKISEQIIDECKSTAVLYKHKKTGAEIMSVSNDDENKVFGVVFRTPPKDSTGIPHILEHSVLCGSKKYPLKEPFVELLKGSLHTFLNAFTYPDRTCYPVASTNIKDFYNLVDVYLDAVFFPKCVDDFQTFQQEGWHYELNDPADEISYKGVVFNEMKGVYSQPDNILGRVTQQALFPENTYGVDSGGDPKDIPKLTFEEFKEFHRKYYHPSNARIWFYGDDDPAERLQILSAYLDQFDASLAPNESKVEPQKLFKAPARIVEKYPAAEGSDLQKKHMVCVNWLLSDEPLDLETELALGFLDHLLLGTPAAPLRRILLESGLGDAIVGGGMEDELLQPQFSIGLKGVSENDIGKVEELIMETLKNLAEEGFAPEAVEASMNTIEFSLRENNTGSFPRGLSLMLRSIGKWIYDMDPFEPLKYEKPLQAFKARIAEAGSKAVFSPLIEKYILNNPHRVTVEMQPDPEKASRDEAAEKEILEKVKASMTEEDLSELARATQDLRLKQETPDPPEALRTVPSLSLQDIPRKPKHVPTEIGEINGVNVLQHDLFTNNVVYSDVVFDMSSVKKELLQLVPLFCQSLLEMGTKDMDFIQLNQLIGRKTGGISVYPFTSSVRGKLDPCMHMIVRGKAMAGRVEDLFNLMSCILQDVQFTEQQRFKQFVSQSKARMESRLRGSGHGIAAARMDAKLNAAGWITEQMGGISYLEFLQDLEKKVDQDWDEISSSLEEIRRSLLSRKGCLVNMTADEKNLNNSTKYLSKFLDSLPSAPSAEINSWNTQLYSENEAIVIPTQVNYVGKAANIYESGYQLNGSSYVISKYIGNTWLWDRVRVSGGAYGGFCDFDSHSGVFSYLSYRDPNLLKTLEVYDGTANFLRELELDDDTITKAIIGTIGDVDSYQLPDAKGYSSLMRYLLGVTNEERERRREEILSTSVKDFKEFADAVEAVKNKGVVVAVASPEDVAAANEQKSGFFNVKKVL